MLCAKRGKAKRMLSSCGAKIAVPNRILDKEEVRWWVRQAAGNGTAKEATSPALHCAWHWCDLAQSHVKCFKKLS